MTVILPIISHAQTHRTTEQAIELARNHLLSSQNADGSIGDGAASDWAAMALAAAATNDSRFSNLKTYITAQAARVDKNSATELERTILALTAVGVTPYNVQNRNLVDELKALASGDQIGSPNLLNDDIFAILAFRAAGQNPTAEPFKSAIEFVKRNQLGSGGFNDRVGGQEADIDITAVGIVALNPYTTTATAKSFLLSAQNNDGGFPSRAGSSSNVASTAWTIWAIGLNQRAAEYLISQQQSTGSFSSILTTSYALHALTGRNIPVATVIAPVQSPASQQVAPQPTSQPTSVPAAVVSPPIPPPDAQPADAGRPVDTPGETLSISKPTTPTRQPKITPAKPVQRAKQKNTQPLASPVARVNRTSNLLLITSSIYPKETLAQTSFEARTVEPPQLSKPAAGSTNLVAGLIAIAAITLVNTFAITLLWQKMRATQLTAPRAALS